MSCWRCASCCKHYGMPPGSGPVRSIQNRLLAHLYGILPEVPEEIAGILPRPMLFRRWGTTWAHVDGQDHLAWALWQLESGIFGDTLTDFNTWLNICQACPIKNKCEEQALSVSLAWDKLNEEAIDEVKKHALEALRKTKESSAKVLEQAKKDAVEKAMCIRSKRRGEGSDVADGAVAAVASPVRQFKRVKTEPRD